MKPQTPNTNHLLKTTKLVDKQQTQTKKYYTRHNDFPIQTQKIYCNMCNGEDEASICVWCFNEALSKKGNITKKQIKLLLDKQRNEHMEWIAVRSPLMAKDFRLRFGK